MDGSTFIMYFQSIDSEPGKHKKVAPDTYEGKEDEVKTIGCITPFGRQLVADGARFSFGFHANIRQWEQRLRRWQP